MDKAKRNKPCRWNRKEGLESKYKRILRLEEQRAGTEIELTEVAFRKKLYKTIEDIQTDLDAFMAWYNAERTNQGRYCQGRTPVQTFMDGLELYQQYVYENPVEEKEVMM